MRLWGVIKDGDDESALLVAQFALWAIIAILLVLVVVVASNSRPPSPNELCQDHHGVLHLDPGGWSAPPVATCNDGYAGRVEV